MIHDVEWLQDDHKWPALTSIVVVGCTRETREKIERETRFCITSSALPSSQIGPAIRDHWAADNNLHWIMDMVFRDDEARLRTDNAPANFTTIEHMALNLIRRTTTKD